MSILETALDKIAAQQPKQRTPVWMVGEQLMDMLRNEPHLAEIIAQDLTVEELSLAECEKKIRAFADAHRTGNFACVTPADAEEIIREFYGLPARGVSAPPDMPAGADTLLHLEDFF